MPRPFDPDLADRIVRVTADILQERGIDGVTIRGVATAAGCSATTIYQRFAGKDELLDGAVVRGLEWFIAAGQEADRGLAGRARLAASAHSYVEWGVRNPAMYRLIFEQRLPKPAEGAELQRRRRGWGMQRDLLSEILTARPASASPVDLDSAADMVFVSLHGTVSLAVSGRLAGPMAPTEVLLARSAGIVDALVEQWADAWGLSV